MDISDIRERCLHPETADDKFCFTCASVVCPKCPYDDHRFHDVYDFREVMDISRQHLQEMIQHPKEKQLKVNVTARRAQHIAKDIKQRWPSVYSSAEIVMYTLKKCLSQLFDQMKELITEMIRTRAMMETTFRHSQMEEIDRGKVANVMEKLTKVGLPAVVSFLQDYGCDPLNSLKELKCFSPCSLDLVEDISFALQSVSQKLEELELIVPLKLCLSILLGTDPGRPQDDKDKENRVQSNLRRHPRHNGGIFESLGEMSGLDFSFSPLETGDLDTDDQVPKIDKGNEVNPDQAKVEPEDKSVSMKASQEESTLTKHQLDTNRSQSVVLESAQDTQILDESSSTLSGGDENMFLDGATNVQEHGIAHLIPERSSTDYEECLKLLSKEIESDINDGKMFAALPLFRNDTTLPLEETSNIAPTLSIPVSNEKENPERASCVLESSSLSDAQEVKRSRLSCPPNSPSGSYEDTAVDEPKKNHSCTQVSDIDMPDAAMDDEESCVNSSITENDPDHQQGSSRHCSPPALSKIDTPAVQSFCMDSVHQLIVIRTMAPWQPYRGPIRVMDYNGNIKQFLGYNVPALSNDISNSRGLCLDTNNSLYVCPVSTKGSPYSATNAFVCVGQNKHSYLPLCEEVFINNLEFDTTSSCYVISHCHSGFIQFICSQTGQCLKQMEQPENHVHHYGMTFCRLGDVSLIASIDGRRRQETDETFLNVVDANGNVHWSHSIGKTKVDDSFNLSFDQFGRVLVADLRHQQLISFCEGENGEILKKRLLRYKQQLQVTSWDISSDPSTGICSFIFNAFDSRSKIYLYSGTDLHDTAI